MRNGKNEKSEAFLRLYIVFYKKQIAAGDTLIPHSSLLIPHYKKFSLTSKEKYVIIKENGMSVKFYDWSNFDENNGYYRLC